MEYTKEYLQKLGIHSLRSVGREIGVRAPSKYVKKQLIEEILAIHNGQKPPHKSKSGRPSLEKVSVVVEENKKEIDLEKAEKELDDIYYRFKKFLFKYVLKN